MPYKDKEKQKEYSRQWVAKRKANWFAGKVCVVCGTTERLELDHIDPTLKESHSIWSWSEKRRAQELAKCQVLCYDHHLEKTVKALKARSAVTHGTLWMYTYYKCRCDLCYKIKQEDNAKRKTRIK